MDSGWPSLHDSPGEAPAAREEKSASSSLLGTATSWSGRRTIYFRATRTSGPTDFYLVAGDLSQPAGCDRLIAEAIARFGRIDVLVNNAGIIQVGPIERADYRETSNGPCACNFFAALYTTLAALPRLRRQHALPGWNRRAAIVNIASIGGKFAMPHMLPYSAAKFALVGFSEGLHAELRHQGIRVTTVCPGLMRTDGERHAHFVGDAVAEQTMVQLCGKNSSSSRLPSTTPQVASTVQSQPAAPRSR